MVTLVVTVLNHSGGVIGGSRHSSLAHSPVNILDIKSLTLMKMGGHSEELNQYSTTSTMPHLVSNQFNHSVSFGLSASDSLGANKIISQTSE